MDNENKSLMEDLLTIQVHTAAVLQNVANVLSSIYVLNLTIALKNNTVTFDEMDSTLEALQDKAEAYEYQHTEHSSGMGVEDTEHSSGIEPQNGLQLHTETTVGELSEMDEYSVPDNVTIFNKRSTKKN